VEDKPGVFAQIATILGEHNISISSLLQHETPENGEIEGVPVVITTHRAREGDVRIALSEVDALDAAKARTVCIGIVDEHPEQI